VIVTEEDSRASFRQAKLLMQAGIDSSLEGEEDAAIKYFGEAKRRFEGLRDTVEAAIARGWLSALKKQQHEHHALR
jgi:hypothetical protein